MSKNAVPILYSYFRSSCSWRVRIALALKDLDYQYEPVNLLLGGQNSETFRRINPLGQVPALVLPASGGGGDDLIITQSMAIIQYLDEVYPAGPRILPADPVRRAVVRGIADTIASQIQPVQNLGLLKRLAANGIGDTKAWARDWIAEQFVALEAMIAKHRGRYCVADEVSLADICLVPQVANANRFGVDMAAFPNIREINGRLLELDAFKRSAPDAMPDCPDKDKA